MGIPKLMKFMLQAIACVIIFNTSFTAYAESTRVLKPNNKEQGEHRIALVIGNSAYTNSPLKNPVNDAKDVANKLRDLGFEVIVRYNLQTKQIGGTLREFRSKLTPGSVALVFYAGHGLQIKGINYLPTVDAEINSEEDVPNQSLGLNQIMDVLEESKSRLNLVFLDACRNNPYARSFRSADRGLARVTAPSGTLISYATKPGSVSADGSGRNGLYTSKLLAQMDSNQQIEQSLKRIVTEVKAASQGKQEPWMEGSIEGDFCFGGCGNLQMPNIILQPSAKPAVNIETVPVITNSAPEFTANKGQGMVPSWVGEVMSKFVKGNVESDSSISIQVPKIAENGSVVPFNIFLSNPILDGDRIVVVVNDKYPAYMVTPQKSTSITFLSGRVKMPTGSGNIRALLINSKGIIKTSSSNLDVTVGVQSFGDGEAAKENIKFKSRTGVSGGMTEFKMLIAYPSSTTSFTEFVNTEFSDGAVEIMLTPVASKNPFVGFKVNSPDKPRYKIFVKDNHGGTSVLEGQSW